MKNMRKIFFGFGVSAFALLGGFVGISQNNVFDSQINEIIEADASVTIELNEQGVYEISTADQLALVSKQIADGVEGYRSASYMLTADINLGTKLWTPIGTADNAFTGDFNGNGYTISNLIVTNESAIDGYYGLFGKVNGGGIYNIILDSGYTTSTVNTSGNLAGSVENCFIGGIYDKNTLGKTIGTVGNGVKFYQGDLSSPNTITARSGSVSITGYLKTYIAHGGIIADSNNYGARIYKESCIVPTTDSSRSSLSSDNFSGFNGVRVGNLNNPSYVYKVGNEGTWVTGSTYTKTVSWTDKSSVSFTFNKPAHEENELADDTVLGYYGKTYEEIVSYLNAYNENFDLIKLELGNVTLFSEAVRYSPQGAKITNDTTICKERF